jgi:hypothetical protein
VANGTLVDNNVLLDVLTDDPTWRDWSGDALADAAEAGPLYIGVGRYRTYFPTVALIAPDR